MVNQVFFVLGELQLDVVEYVKKYEMIFEVYSLLGIGKIFDVFEMK